MKAYLPSTICIVVAAYAFVACAQQTSGRKVSLRSSESTIKPIDGPEEKQPDAPQTIKNDELIEGVSLRVESSGSCLVRSSDPSSSTPIVQEKCDGNDNEKWDIKSLGNDQHRITTPGNNLCLTAKADGAPIVLAVCDEELTTQRWRFYTLTSQLLEIVSVHNDHCLDVEKNSKQVGSPIIVWPCSQRYNQLWSTRPDSFKLPAKGRPKVEAPFVAKPVKPISCRKMPEVSIEWSTVWTKKFNGGNSRYENFFTPVVHYKGSSYWVWLDAKGRPFVSKISNGKTETEALDPKPDFVASEGGHHIFSLGIDSEGYLHIAGNMQNYTKNNKDYPSRYQHRGILYWRSSMPETVKSEFEFIGELDNPRRIPGSGYNGIRFFTDNFGKLYASATVDAIAHGAYAGRRGISLYKYDASTRRWSTLGAQPPKSAAQRRDAEINKVFFWEIGGAGPYGYWQGFLSVFRFDAANHLHFATTVNTDRNVEKDTMIIYAKSEDGGMSWKRIDGDNISGLPVRASQDEAGRGDLVATGEFDWQSSVVADRNGRPAIRVVQIERRTNSSDLWNDTWYAWNGSAWTRDHSLNKLANIPYNGNLAPGGALILTPLDDPGEVYCQEDFLTPAVSYKIAELRKFTRFVGIDPHGLRTTGAVYGIGVNEPGGQQSLIKIQFKQ